MKKIFLSIAVLGLALSSCDDFLTKDPLMNQTSDIALSTFEGIDDATEGNYLSVISWYGASVPLTFDVMCGNGMVGPVNTGRMRQEPAWNFTPTSELGLWASAYSAILNCNKVLAAINQNEFTRTSDVTEADINNVKAENLFLRALAYFDLVRVYAQPYGYIKEKGLTGVEAMGVPIITVEDITARPARNTVAEVYENLIIPDLEEAERLMDPSYERADVADRVATISTPVIQAMMARVYLEHEDFQLAADYATKVIKNGRFRLLSGNNFLSMWKGRDIAPWTGDEFIFEVYIAQSDGSRTALGTYLTAPEEIGGAGYGDVRMSNDLINLFDETDIRYTGLTKTNPRYPGYRWCTKYPGKTGGLQYNNVPVIRISEMYLIRSEAMLRGNAVVSGVSSPLDDLNRVATSRGASAYSTATVSNIFEERRKEFFFEGYVFFDMKRLQISLYREDYDLDETVRDVEFPSYRWALPIPENDVLNNSNMDQNPGYQQS